MEKINEKLPQIIEDDINALIDGIKNNSTVLDCLEMELEASINGCLATRQISKKTADKLRNHYIDR